MVSDDGGGTASARSPPESPERAWGRLTEQTTRLATGERRADDTPIFVVASFRFASAAFALDRAPTQGDKTSRSETARGKRPRVETGGRRPRVADRVGRSQKATRGRSPTEPQRTTLGGGGEFEIAGRWSSFGVVYATDVRRCAIRSTLRRSRVHGEREREARSDHRRNP